MPLGLPRLACVPGPGQVRDLGSLGVGQEGPVERILLRPRTLPVILRRLADSEPGERLAGTWSGELHPWSGGLPCSWGIREPRGPVEWGANSAMGYFVISRQLGQNSTCSWGG